VWRRCAATVTVPSRSEPPAQSAGPNDGGHALSSPVGRGTWSDGRERPVMTRRLPDDLATDENRYIGVLADVVQTTESGCPGVTPLWRESLGS